ncbi:serine/threonine-protein kinase [Ponticaulis sp.]|uniref:serine/threonine-protein kinase n=1 Tax=Ponticaulis sp. TaxID=2020902 RepID=UPI000B63CF5C|nr:serine/threonine-protein kinase [Ponticaulis sp.]MAI91219.1 hypothetical protein [Ponticaulis sp.]OUX98532.1 MAG: hypothetical protein CBB65_12295 [Hyphomonadaceae bacterium TMED5]|tara:strand:- start:64655 stop:66817 length:2163 start_codon:yes stop_codon:yes gene_type:complete
MRIENWEQVSHLFDQAMEKPEDERAGYVQSEASSPELAEQVLRLISAAERETGFLATGESGQVVDRVILEPGTRLGNWKIESPLGAGGMGEVYLVTRADGLYDQVAALKLIASYDANAWERFSRERQVLASLEDPGIGRLIDGGVAEDGRPFLVMEHVDGQPIDAFVTDKKLSTSQKLKLFLHVCDAVSHAHGRLVLHRDIKPANILVTGDGIPRLIDFGVASLLDGDDEDLKAPMTLRYAAPEQLSGDPASVATDVFGLGATLHELLTSAPPTRKGRSLLVETGGMTASLAAILSTALADAPNARYSSVGAFAADIRAYLDDRPVAAMPGGAGYELGLFLKRNTIAASAVIAVFLALGAGLAGTLWQAEQTREERDLAIRERERLRTMQQATFVMFSEASDGADTTTRELVTRSAEQVLADFQNDPAEAAPVLHMYGELFYLMNDYQAAEPLLRAVADNDTGEVETAISALARHDLAVVLFRMGDVDTARDYLAQAEAMWTEDPVQFRYQILDGYLLESQLLAHDGEMAEAEAVLANALPERLAVSGRDSMDTAILYNNLGAARMRIGDLPGAIEASENARDVFASVERLESPDGLNTMNNLATLYHVTGDLEAAETAYSETLRLRQNLFGGSVATAVLMSNYAKLKLQKGDAEGALDLFDVAIPMADEYGGASGPASLAARFGKAEALILTARLEEADILLEESSGLLAEGGLTGSVY